MFDLKNEFYLKIILIISFTALIFAYFVEHILGHQPCNLCIIERIPYGISIILITTIFIVKKNQKFLTLLLILTFVFSLTISIYHYGIEQGFFEESTVCNVRSFTENITKEDLLKELSKKTISCKDVTFKFFGFSLTSINVVLSLLFIITLIKIFIRYEKNK